MFVMGDVQEPDGANWSILPALIVRVMCLDSNFTLLEYFQLLGGANVCRQPRAKDPMSPLVSSL